MVNLYYVYPFSPKRLYRMVFLMLSPGVITILCHASIFFPGDRVYATPSLFRESITYGHADLAVSLALTGRGGQTQGPAPTAENDFATTPEETPVTIPILENDKAGTNADDEDDDNDDNDDGDDDDDDDDGNGDEGDGDKGDGDQDRDQNGDDDLKIDASTVDLDPVEEGRQTSRATNEGMFDVNTSGHVTFFPTLNFFGNSVIQYTVDSRSGETSNPATVHLTVSNVNDAPLITGFQNPIHADAGKPVTITLDDLIFADPDNQLSGDFSLAILPGDHYTVSGTAVTPQAEFSGVLPVSVQVSDGIALSAPFVIQLNVTQQNVRPVITGQQPVTTEENQPVTITFAHLTVNDPDDDYPTRFTIQVGAGENYTVSGQTITPNANFVGTLTVPVTVNDGHTTSEVFSFTVTVTAKNDPPVITGQTPLSTQEQTPLAISLSNILVTDSDNSYPGDFTLRLLPGNNYSIDGDLIIPVLDFEGTLQVPVVVNDGTDDSQPFNLSVTVEGVNDAPVITGQSALSTTEDQTITLELAHLTVTDPDNAYPADFALSVLSGSNYSVSGNQLTPSSGFNGTLTVGVVVNDGMANSNIFYVEILVTPSNDPPVISGQREVVMEEGTSITLTLQDLTVTDVDNTYPEGFTLLVQAGSQYTFSGATVTPSPDFNGTLSVNVIVNDGAANSAPFSLAITVTPVNDPPQIIGPATLSTNEDVPLAIALADLQITDPDNTSGFTFLLFAGAHYTVSGNTIIPERDYSGPLYVEIQASDGSLTSNIFMLTVQVVPVNDAPVITGQLPVQTAEDTPVTIQLSHVTVLDVDNVYPAGFSLVVSPGANYTVAGTTITPATDFNGTLNVGLMVSDGAAQSAPFNFQIQVGNANDAPTITGQAALTTNEEQGVTLALSHLTVTDPDNSYPAGFTLLVSPGSNYTVSGQTILPAINFAGFLSIPVRVNDGVNNSATFIFKLQVSQVNDAPVFDAIPNQQVSENTPAGSVSITGISKGPMEADQQITFVATSGNTSVIADPVIQYNGGSTAALSYSVVPNTSGIVTITIVAIDNGSNVPPNENSYSASFQIEVLEINAAPTLDAINNVTILEDAEQQNVTLTGITAGPGETQALSVSVTTDKPDFFGLLEVVYSSPESSGLLRFHPKPNIFGTAQFSITVTDNGAATSPHVNKITRTFSVVIQPVNDPPVFTSAPVTVALINDRYSYQVRATDPDGERITFSAITKPSWATLSGSGNGQATLSGVPPDAALGSAEVVLSARDVTTSVEQRFFIYVNVRPSISTLTLATEEDTSVGFPAGFFAGGYTDRNDNALSEILITAVPTLGDLTLSDVAVKAGDTIPVESLSALVYTPDENYFGMDTFGWNASDGYHFSDKAARVDISIVSVNDPPQIVFEHDTLHYEVNGEPAFLSPLIDIIDPDDDTLTHVSIVFNSQNYRPETDLLLFQNTANIRSNFDFQAGRLQFSGVATQAEYRTALRSIQYLHQNTLDPVLEPKHLSFVMHDGEAEGMPEEKVIMLEYTFIEFEIPSGFTPNGDTANDTWIIDRPGGGLEEMDNAIISVYNKHGVLVYRAKGFDRPWDGRRSGELLPAGSYFYTIDLQLRNKKTYKGIVTILR